MSLDGCGVDTFFWINGSLRWQSVQLLVDLGSLSVKHSSLLNALWLNLQLLEHLSIPGQTFLQLRWFWVESVVESPLVF